MSVNVHKQGTTVKNKFRRYAGQSNYGLTASARKGISTEIFYSLALIAKMPESALARLIHISPRTIGNYKENKKLLDPVQSEHLLKLVALYEKGEELFGNIDEFNYWLQKPIWNDNERPLDWLVTPGGVDVILEDLSKLAYGDAV